MNNSSYYRCLRSNQAFREVQDVSGPDTSVESNLEGRVDTHSAGETPLVRTNTAVEDVVMHVGLVRCAGVCALESRHHQLIDRP